MIILHFKNEENIKKNKNDIYQYYYHYYLTTT